MGGFVKIDCGVLDSTLWNDHPALDLFFTSLFMAEPVELAEPTCTYAVRSLDIDGFIVPPGWYGIVRAAGVAIVRRNGRYQPEDGLAALERLAAPDPESRSSKFGGRRLVRVEGGFIVLRYQDFRDRDYTSAARSKRWRDRKRGDATRRVDTGERRDNTQAEAEAEAEGIREREEGIAPSALALPLPSVGPEFPVAGSRAPWTCPADFAAELVKLYPNVAILAEMEKAAVKIKRGAVTKKTPKGMPKFLMSWMERVQNSARPTTQPEAERRNFLKPGERPTYTGDHRTKEPA